MKKIGLITGATSGLGLALAKKLLMQNDIQLILPVRNAQRAKELQLAFTSEKANQLSFPIMDLSNLTSVRAFAGSMKETLKGSLDIVMLNAGTQSATQTIYTDDGLEQTFGVNHLAHHVLLSNIEPLLSPNAVIGWVGSGTHHPELAKTFGYTGAHYIAPELLVKGEFPNISDSSQASRNAYSTSKGLNILSARYFSRHSVTSNPSRRYFSFDPGLMPGTGLAREGGAVQRFAWTYILPIAAKLMKGTSTPQRSAAMLADVLLRKKTINSGDYVEFTGHILQPHLPNNEEAYAKEIFDFSNRYL
ncbi:MAG: SDR family NAD(P)-dependent oxidoreductase [Burkholderiaceae bacterium]